MSVLAPPRQPVPEHPRTEVERRRAQEALIKEARRRARRRRQRHAALALLGITSVLAIVPGRISGGHPNGASTIPGASMHVEPPTARQRKPGRPCAIGASWSRDGTSAFFNTARRTPADCRAVVLTIVTSPDGRKIAVAVTRTAKAS